MKSFVNTCTAVAWINAVLKLLIIGNMDLKTAKHLQEHEVNNTDNQNKIETSERSAKDQEETLPKKPITYSDAVKANDTKKSEWEEVERESDALRRKMKTVKAEYAKLKRDLYERIENGHKTIKEKVEMIHDCLLLNRPVKYFCKHENHKNDDCIPAVQKLTQLNDRLVKQVIASRKTYNDIKQMYFDTKRRSDVFKDLVRLRTSPDGHQESKKALEHKYVRCSKCLENINKEICELQKFIKHCGSTADAFMLERVKSLSDNVETLEQTVLSLEQEVKDAETKVNEKQLKLDCLKKRLQKKENQNLLPIEQRRDIQKLSLERQGFVKCMHELYVERDDVLSQFVEVKNEMKAIEDAVGFEERCKEKMFMQMVLQLEIQKKLKEQSDQVKLRQQQLNKELAVRNTFLQTKQLMADKLFRECTSLEQKLSVSLAEEESFKVRNKSLIDKITRLVDQKFFSNMENQLTPLSMTSCVAT